jgi:hypothetical protein
MQAPDSDPEIWALYVWNNKLYAAGTFNEAGDSLANNIASWNDTTWSPLGSGTNTQGTPYNDGYVFAIGEYSNDIYIGGNFDSAGGVSSKWLSRWNGVNWDSVGGGIDGPVSCFSVFQKNLYLGGAFDTAGIIYAQGGVRWNDTIFSLIGSGIGGDVSAMDTFNHSLYVGGDYRYCGGILVNNIARWGPDTATDIGQMSTTNNTVKIYPNPTSNQLIFNSSQLMEQLQIENALGQTLVDENFNYWLQKQTMDVSSFPQGIYFYRITNSNSQVVTGKFVKE